MTTPTPEQIEAAFYALRSETIEQTWFEREIRQAITAKDARIKELETQMKSLISHAKDCERQLDWLHGLGENAGAGYSVVVCNAEKALAAKE